MATARETRTMALLDSLRNNTATRVLLELTSATNLVEIQEALHANTSLQCAEILFDTAFNQRTQEDLFAFIQSIGRCSNLRQLTLKSNSDEQLSYYDLPLRMITCVLDIAQGVRSLTLGDIMLSGTTDDFSALEESMQNHTSLEELSCTCWLSEQTRMAVSASVDPLLRVIAASISLQSLYFQPAFFGGDVTSVTAGMLGSLPRLQSMNISKCHLSNEAMMAMATALQDNKVLRELRLTCQLEEPGCLAVAQCLRENATLELLSIHNTYTNIHIDTTNIVISETKSGPNGDTDESDETTVDDDHYLPIAQALQEANRTLRHLDLHGTRLCKPSQEAFAEMMKDNYSLVEVSLLGLSDTLQGKIDMFSVLNRCGRENLMRRGGAERWQWIDTMAQVRSDLDCLFYLLSTKPSLCDLDNAGSQSAATTKRKHDRKEQDQSAKRPRSS